MPIQLGAFVFDPAAVAVQEHVEEVGGRDARVVRLSGVVQAGYYGEDVDAALDALAAAAAEELTPLILRAGRRLWVRRRSMRREATRGGRTGAFVLEVEAPDPYEESIDAHAVEGLVNAGDALSAANAGNAPAPLHATLVGMGSLEQPSLSDGTRTLTYDGIVPWGEVLTLDGAARQAFIGEADVSAYLKGEWPVLAPGPTRSPSAAVPAVRRAAPWH